MLRRTAAWPVIRDRSDAGVPGRARRSARELRLHEFSKAKPVPSEPHRFVDRVGARFEPGHAIEHVVRPARLAVLPVVDDVDASAALLLNDVNSGLTQCGFVACLMLLVFPRCRCLFEEVGGADQAADVCGQNAIGTASHANFGSYCEMILIHSSRAGPALWTGRHGSYWRDTGAATRVPREAARRARWHLTPAPEGLEHRFQ